LPTKGFSMFVSLVWLERPSQLILDRLENWDRHKFNQNVDTMNQYVVYFFGVFFCPGWVHDFRSEEPAKTNKIGFFPTWRCKIDYAGLVRSSNRSKIALNSSQEAQRLASDNYKMTFKTWHRMNSRYVQVSPW
jgi:hypothetical protein